MGKPNPRLVKANNLEIPEGIPAAIPAVMIKEILFPIPRSVICSPNHIRNIVPVTKLTTVEIWNSKELVTITPC